MGKPANSFRKRSAPAGSGSPTPCTPRNRMVRPRSASRNRKWVKVAPARPSVPPEAYFHQKKEALRPAVPKRPARRQGGVASISKNERGAISCRESPPSGKRLVCGAPANRVHLRKKVNFRRSLYTRLFHLLFEFR